MATYLTIIDSDNVSLPAFGEIEQGYVQEARGLFEQRFYPYALLAIWNAAIVNLRRRVECYGVELFLSVVKDESGRKKYDQNGDSLSQRWEGVDDHILITGSTRLGLLNPKAGKSLEMINWMRNHVSPAHPNDHAVDQEDVVAHTMIIQKNLFEFPMPVAGHRVSDLFDPIKQKKLIADELDMLADQIRALNTQNLRICFGFMLNLLAKGQHPSIENVVHLFPIAWERANEDLRQTVGIKLHTLRIDPDSDDSSDKGAAQRCFDFLVSVKGVKYIPDAHRAKLYRSAAKVLADAKDKQYGWRDEEAAAHIIAQYGAEVPSIAFEEVYQEIIAAWCGNYWGRSDVYLILENFITDLNRDQLRSIVQMFHNNERVKNELFQKRPKEYAVALLTEIKNTLVNVSHQQEVDAAISFVQAL